jgi:hypothetical protein
MKKILLFAVLSMSACQYTNEFVYEEFEITENANGEIRGGLISTSEITGEGIYLDETYKGYDLLKDVEVGTRIKVTYDKDDYKNEVWDNIVDIDVIK